MYLFKNQNGDIYAYSDDDFINLAKQKYPQKKLSDDEIENNFTDAELNAKGREIITDDYGYTPFSYTPEELTVKQIAEAKERELNQAKNLLKQSKELESGVYQRRMSETEQMEFIQWQDALLEFINDERTEIPPTPEFINTLLGA